MADFPISEKDLAVLFETILNDRTNGLSPALDPQFFLNAGQPGAGKTELNRLTQTLLADQVLECNADTLRGYHPEEAQILREHEQEYPDLTWPAADHWNRLLIDAGIAHQHHLLIETTLRRADQALDTFARMKANGYTTNLQVLAVPYRWSWLGIHLRFESIKARKGFARRVSDEDHDDRFARLRMNLAPVLGSTHIDQASIYRRQLSVSEDAVFTLALVTKNKDHALAAFLDVINTPMDEAERGLFNLDFERVIHFMEDREAPPESISAFKAKAEAFAQE